MVMISLLYHNDLDQSASQMVIMRNSNVMTTLRSVGVLTRMAMRLLEPEQPGLLSVLQLVSCLFCKAAQMGMAYFEQTVHLQRVQP